MQTAECLNHLAPYLFAQIDAKKAALTEQGIDVISLGIGDPDMPTPAHIVDAMAEATRNPADHQYPDYARFARLSSSLRRLHEAQVRRDTRSEN